MSQADMLEAGLEWLAAELANHASQEILLQRGVATIETAGTLSNGRITVEGAGGALLVVESDDWTIAASAWATLTPDVPQRGDKVVATIAGKTKTYEVFPADGEHCYQDLGGLGVLFQVHTKVRG